MLAGASIRARRCTVTSRASIKRSEVFDTARTVTRAPGAQSTGSGDTAQTR